MKYKVGFELNTSTWRKGLNEPMPEEKLFRELIKLGIEDVTIGSDAHSPNQVGYGIDRAMLLIKNCGIKELTIYKKHRPVRIAIQSNNYNSNKIIHEL
jgi:histidinol-phosphatase (PHP family)